MAAAKRLFPKKFLENKKKATNNSLSNPFTSVLKMPITASMLYDLVACPHRVTMDIFGDPSKRDEVNVFIKLLWERGTLFERETICNLEIPFLDLSSYHGDEKNAKNSRSNGGKNLLNIWWKNMRR